MALSTSNLTPLQLKSLSRSRKVEALRDLRSRPSRNPNAVVLLAAEALAGGSLGDETYTIHEQYFIACLELGNIEQAGKSLVLLVKQFGNSSIRIQKLHGLRAESAGDIAKARSIYESILKDSPADAFVVKRFSAMCKAEGRYQDAVEALETTQWYVDEDKNRHRFLAMHNTDESTYRELLNLHYLMGKWERCVFYAEEVILMSPHAFLNHVRHAEVCYAAKMYERSASAYAHALTLNDAANNARAAFGLWTVAKEILAKAKSSGSKNSSDGTAVSLEDAQQLRQWAVQRLKALYHGKTTSGALELMLQREN
ncbi:Hypothetical protein, putative [Bodo saltans]|uniref:ER membrane protein complex subunit 2 n=1 Tax=Bodo saltans TaxID=75058 RepID=A0A0S4J0N8_BODSA|nr:Hypothetical protein, putative [Bodo saltans]|eukprot:CUG74733.1 Hypothetical protein, putative [Bodo saltans]